MIAVGLDFDHTLGVDHKLERTAFLRLAGELDHGIDSDDLARIGQIDTLLADLRRDQFSLDDAVMRFIRSLGEKPRAEHVERFKSLCYDLVPGHVEAIPGAVDLIAYLRDRGVPHAVLTNGWSPLQEKKCAQVGFEGRILVSQVLGVSKPARAAFDALRAVFPSEADVWYVGDNPSTDVGGALDAGMRGIWLDLEEMIYPPECPPPTYTVHRLREVIDLLEDPERLTATA